MINLRSNITIDNYNSYDLPREEYEPVLKKIKFSSEGLYQKSNTNPESLSEKSISIIDNDPIKNESFQNWFDVYDEAFRTGNPASLIDLIGQGLLDDLNEDEMEMLFKFARANKNREIILECAKAKVSPEIREGALNFAFQTNDFELAKITLDGAKKQKQWNLLTHNNNPFNSLNNLIDRGVNSPIIDLFFPYYGLDPAKVEEYDWRKYLANVWGVEGSFRLNGDKHDYMGSWMHHFTDRIMSSFQAFNRDNPNAIAPELIKTLLKVIDDSRDVKDTSEKLKIYQNNQPIIIHAGLKGHQIEIVLWSNYLLICNKGFLSEEPIKTFFIDPHLVNSVLFNKIKICDTKFDDKKAEIFFASTLPKLLNGVFHPLLTELFTNEWIDEALEQEKDNCVWESLRTAMFGIAGLYDWINNDCENQTDTFFQQETISNALKKLRPWDNYVGLHGLGQYIDFSAKDPTKLDRKLAMSILNFAKELMYEGEIAYCHYEEVVGKFIRARAKAIEIENVDLGMDVEGVVC